MPKWATNGWQTMVSLAIDESQAERHDHSHGAPVWFNWQGLPQARRNDKGEPLAEANRYEAPGRTGWSEEFEGRRDQSIDTNTSGRLI